MKITCALQERKGLHYTRVIVCSEVWAADFLLILHLCLAEARMVQVQHMQRLKCPGSGRVLLTLNQISYQSCKHLCKRVTACLVLTSGSTCWTLNQGWSGCLCRQGGLRVTHAKIFDATGQWAGLVTWTGCDVSVVTPAEGCAGWLCSEPWGGWMCCLCGWEESALPNLQQNVLLKHILCVKSLKMSSKKTRVFNFNHSYILLH